MIYLPTGRSDTDTDPWLHDLQISRTWAFPRFTMRRRHILTPVSDVCEAASISLFWAPRWLNQLPEVRFANHDAYSNCCWYTGGDPEQEFRRCFADRLNQSLLWPVAQATEMLFLLYTWNLKQKDPPPYQKPWEYQVGRLFAYPRSTFGLRFKPTHRLKLLLC